MSDWNLLSRQQMKTRKAFDEVTRDLYFQTELLADEKEAFLRIKDWMVLAYIIPSIEQPNRWTYPKSGEEPAEFETRQRNKLLRILKRRMPSEGLKGMPDHKLTRIINLLNLQLWDVNASVEYGTGQFIQDAYNEIHLGSCMYQCDMALLVNNPKVVGLIRFGNDARALVWTIGDKKYLDRIYPNDGSDYHHQILRTYAEDKGWPIRTHHSLPEGTICFGEAAETLQVELDTSGVDFWPYMDSFRHYNEYYGTFSTDETSSYDHVLAETDGTFEGGSTCYNCSDSAEGFEHDGNDYCEYCYTDVFFYCERCDETEFREDSRYIEDLGVDWCQHCADNYAQYCNDCGEYFSEDHMTQVPNGTPVCENCRDRNYFHCEECEEYIPNEYRNETEDMTEICDGCVASVTNDYHRCECGSSKITDNKYCEECEDEQAESEELEEASKCVAV